MLNTTISTINPMPGRWLGSRCLLALGMACGMHPPVEVAAVEVAAVTTATRPGPEFSRAGFYPLAGTGRQAAALNVAWRFAKADVAHGEANACDDKAWPIVSLPHGLEYLPIDASGGVNYQGPAWYRKHFTPDPALKGQKVSLHFEAIMGKCTIWVNGTQVAEHFGGYLPVIAEVSQQLKWGTDNVIAVRTDNRDDPLYPPGKPQSALDFCYFGGIYRDAWLVSHRSVFITDPNAEDIPAGGGLLVAYDQVSDQHANVLLKLHVRNATSQAFAGTVAYTLRGKDGQVVQQASGKIAIAKESAAISTETMTVASPRLWSPESPFLYHLDVVVKDSAGAVVDGYTQRIGIRSIEFKQADGLWLNGKPYQEKLIGANRHQDFAVVGNALPNSTHWRDAKKLRDAGMRVIRTAHCPADPAFMEACDELGLLVMVNTPGWQFWNKDPLFATRVYQDIRNVVRQNRNHASLFFWEPILNETSYPADFAKKAAAIVAEEFPYANSTASCDDGADGAEYFPLLLRPRKTLDPAKTYFYREWGDNCDDWSAQNSTSRVNRGWGEAPMLVQALGYASKGVSIDSICATPRQIVGGCLWHSFDHQRGYHPVPFLGGILDAFRQPKYSYYLFQAQRSPVKSDLIADNGPMVFIAHEMTPFSGKDVTVYSNCDEVRLTFLKDGKPKTLAKDPKRVGMPSPVFTFADVFDFAPCKAKARAGKEDEVLLVAEGLIGGKVVATHEVRPAGRAEKVVLRLDNEGLDLVANGADFVPVVASLVDKRGTVKRLTSDQVQFSIEGEGRLLGGAEQQLNPRPLSWGTAPMLVQATTVPGKITVKARILFPGDNRPLAGEVTFSSVKDPVPGVFSPSEADQIKGPSAMLGTVSAPAASDLKQENEQLRRELNALRLKEVGKQQSAFGEGIN